MSICTANSKHCCITRPHSASNASIVPLVSFSLTITTNHHLLPTVNIIIMLHHTHAVHRCGLLLQMSHMAWSVSWAHRWAMH